MIQLEGIKVFIDDPEFDKKYVLSARLIDPENEGYDKMFTLAGNNLDQILAYAEYQLTVVFSAWDPANMDDLNKKLKEYQA